MLSLLCGCTPSSDDPTLNGRAISSYTVVYSETEPAYNQRAAEYIQAQIAERTGVTLEVKTTQSGSYKNEIIVGETDRKLSQKLEADTENVNFT